MQEAENAIRQIGGLAVDTMHGLDSASLEGSLPFLAGVLILVLIVKFFSMPFKLIWNGIVGAIMLWLINLIGGLFGFGLKITIIKALIAGIFGVPGVLAVLAWEIFIK